MNGKFEEKLAQVAFGDVTPDEAARIEAEAGKNPAARSALAEFRDMRDGLRDLAEVPEHQLSNERLREAILARGLHPEPVKEKSGPALGWLWMPAAALALGYGLMTFRPHSSAVEPTVVMGANNPVAFNTQVGMPDPNEFLKSPTFSSVAKSAEPSRPKVTPTLVVNKNSSDGPSYRRVHRRRDPRFTPDITPLNPPKWKSPMFAKNDPDVHSGPLAPGVPKDAVASKTPIVLIDSSPDAATGAPTATEVGTASNVLIGG